MQATDTLATQAIRCFAASVLWLMDVPPISKIQIHAAANKFAASCLCILLHPGLVYFILYSDIFKSCIYLHILLGKIFHCGQLFYLIVLYINCLSIDIVDLCNRLICRTNDLRLIFSGSLPHKFRQMG